jgi:hypothetical protein
MVEQNDRNAKYHIEIGQAQGMVISDYAHVEQHFHPAPPQPPPASRDELLDAIREANAELRAYPSDIAGIHIERAEVAQIVEWALEADPKERLGMLQDQPGGGKTVVMRDVLECLEVEGVPVLAIKADTLSGVKTRDDLADRLGLPATVEECGRALATERPFVVLLDQLDALSLALSRDQATLDVMLSSLARLRDLDGVRIVASCRIFELNNDPRLSTIKVDQKFELQPLGESEVNRVLQAIGVDATRLLPAHRTLITVPLHLKVYAQVVAGDTPQGPPESFRTLQELYEALWQRRIRSVPPENPPPLARRTAIYRLVDAMQSTRQLTAPVAVLDEYSEAANYLEREGFIRREGSNWLFSHQTLFDYCYTRRFAAQRKSLSQEILDSPQGLFERSQMVQVLAYLRGADEATYRRELTHLLLSDDLRVHLRLLLIGWFGSLPDPTADELRIAHRLMSAADGQVQFLQAVSGNEGWFDLLSDEVLPSLLRADDERLVDVAIRYLGTLIQQRTTVILGHLRPYLGTSEPWDARITFCLSRLDEWHSDEALDMLCDLFQRGRAGGWGDHCLYQLACSNPAAGCRALQAYLDRRLDDLLAQEQAESQNAESDPLALYRTGLPDRFKWEQQLLGEYAIGEVMKAAVHVCPEAVIEHLLPWFVRAVLILTEPRKRDNYYSSDTLFAWGWYEEHISGGADFARRMAEALCHLAQTKPTEFRTVAAELAAVESLAVQRVLAQAYLSDPRTYASDVFEYLTTDPRRLNIGEELESPRYDSCRLFGAAFSYVNADRRAVLEQPVLDLRPTWERFQSRGITQLRFLKSVPPELLSPTARDRLGELERKFPGFELRPPQGSVGGFIGSPIDQAAQATMSDEAWLGAMRKYDDSGYEHPDFLKGGARQLASSLAEQVKANPERFYRLAAKCFDENISLHYIAAVISGLAGSDASAEWVFDLVRRLAPRIEGEFRSGVCWALEKRAETGVPDHLLDLMADWALNDPDPTEELWRVPASGDTPYYRGDPFEHGINTNRGAALRAVCRCAMKCKPPQVERAFRLLEQAARDPSTAVRTCVIESLGPLLNENDIRALTIFERTSDGHPWLSQSPLVHRFLYWTYYHHFPRIRHSIESLLVNPDDATRQAGARLACLAAFRYPEARGLAKQVIGCPPHRSGEGFKRSLLVAIRRFQFHIWRVFTSLRGQFVQNDAAMRQGAAQVYARNLEKQDLEDICRRRLLQLMNDLDDQVRSHVGKCFIHLRAEHPDRLRPFIGQFLASPALMSGAERLIKYLAPLAADVPDLALEVTERILDVAGSEVTDVRTAASIMERDLVRLPLTVYTHTSDQAEKSRAMDLFEHLLLLGSQTAHQALADWDRR